ncbi:MAG: hypothetical protein KJP00_11920 [Bacteroidia bacterium]|nr:hypothetical protein [Bacteroidia bacterium]
MQSTISFVRLRTYLDKRPFLGRGFRKSVEKKMPIHKLRYSGLRGFFLLPLIFAIHFGYGQIDLEMELHENDVLKLEEIAKRMINDPFVDERIAANTKFKEGLLSLLNQSSARAQTFEEFESISIVNSGDGFFRIFSWQIEINSNEFKHEGIIQFLRGDKGIVVLKDRSSEIMRPNTKELSTEQWFGTLYYNIVPFKSKGKSRYLLFGFDGATSIENCKIADILTIERDEITFGAPLFLSKQNGKEQKEFRVFHQYDQNVKAVMNYDPNLEIIIYDHLIPWNSKEIGVGMTFVPDGSYQGFELKKGKWRHISKVFHHVSQSPIGPKNPTGAAINEKENQE